MTFPSLRQQCRDALASGNGPRAMAICGSCPNPERDPLIRTASRGMSAALSPGFYRSMGQDPAKLIAEGIEAAIQWSLITPAAR